MHFRHTDQVMCMPPVHACWWAGAARFRESPANSQTGEKGRQAGRESPTTTDGERVDVTTTQGGTIRHGQRTAVAPYRPTPSPGSSCPSLGFMVYSISSPLWQASLPISIGVVTSTLSPYVVVGLSLPACLPFSPVCDQNVLVRPIP